MKLDPLSKNELFLDVKEFHLLADYYDPLTNSLNFPIYPFDRIFCNELEKVRSLFGL